MEQSNNAASAPHFMTTRLPLVGTLQVTSVDTGQTVVVLRPDGSVEYGDGYDAESAVLALLQMLAKREW